MLVIGYDRYNVIVKGFNGTKITHGKAFGIILASWIYGIVTCSGPFIGWGNYALGKSISITDGQTKQICSDFEFCILQRDNCSPAAMTT